MSKKIKAWLIIAACIVAVLCIVVFPGSINALNLETNDYEIHQDYQNISIITSTADIIFAPSASGTSLVSCYEQKNMKHAVSVNNGTLTIQVVDTRRWYEFPAIAFHTPKITVYLPQEEYGALFLKSSTGDVTLNISARDEVKIKTDTGNISVEDISAGELELSAATGKIAVSNVDCKDDVSIRVNTGKTTLTDVTCKELASEGDTGDIILKNVIALEEFSISTDTGDVRFDHSDAAEIFVETDTGNVTGTLLSHKIFIVETDTGHIDVPKTVTGGRCEIETDTGDIKITIP